ncbi:MAG TPA: FecR domain-containing protein [Ignavibacteria bacterium]|nr:FecR domain-containing protein [Ignavibacteria bacterium]
MNTKEFYKLLNEYLDGTIQSDALAKLMQAVENDPSYKKEFDAYAEVTGRASSLPKDIITPDGMWDSIENRLTEKGSSFVKVSDNFYTFNADDAKSSEYNDINKQRSVQMPTRYIVSGLIAAGLLVALFFGLKDILFKGNVDQQFAGVDTYWMVSNVKGSPKVDDKTFAGIDSVKIGDWLITDDSSQALLKVSDIGTIVVDPGSKVKMLKSVAGEHRIILEYGTISADINAPPRTFFIEANSVTAVDLGCSYSFTVDKKGDGILYVKEGMVELVSDKRETIVPAGKYCLTKSGVGPGTPYREGSSPEFKRALLNYDFKNGGAAALNTILKNAGKQDAVTLLNLMPVVDKNSKGKVYAKLAGFVNTPGNYPKDSIPYFDYKKMNEWIDDIAFQVSKEMEKVNKELSQMHYNFKFNFDSLKFSDEMKYEFDMEMKELQKELEESLKDFQFDQEEFKRDMEEMKRELKENLKDQEYFNSEEFKRDMEEMQREMENNKEYFDSDEFKNEMKKMNEDLEKDLKESLKDLDYFDSEEFKKNLEESLKGLEYLNTPEFREELNKEIQKEIEKEKNKDGDNNNESEEEEFEYEYD